jgi:hypothetical protein
MKQTTANLRKTKKRSEADSNTYNGENKAEANCDVGDTGHGVDAHPGPSRNHGARGDDTTALGGMTPPP